MTEFTPEEYKIIHQAVRYYQINDVTFNGKDYENCSSVLDKIFPLVYTQRKEQPR
jgi:hypothetical protein